MFIHLNLLAEAQAAEELRRRDPVKRALWLAGLLVALMLAWSGWLQFRATLAQHALARVEADITSRTNDFDQVLEFQNKSVEIESKLNRLHELATNRFLNGNLLNALQQATSDHVQLLRLKTDHVYTFTEETKKKPSESGRAIPARPATATEKITLTLEAKDSSPSPGGEEMLRFKEKIAGHAYFQNALGKANEVRLTYYSPPQSAPGGPPFVQFTLECRFPEKTR